MRLPLLRRVHSATGLFPLGAYLFFHAWQHWPVREGRDALFERLEQTSVPLLELLFVFLPLVAHAALGLKLTSSPDPQRAYASPAFRRLQLVSGLVSAPFLVFELLVSWLPRLSSPTPLAEAYGATRDASGDLPGLTLYCIGLAAVCTHFGQGSGVALGRLVPGLLPPDRARVLGIVLGVSLWLVLLNELASYATLAPLL